MPLPRSTADGPRAAAEGIERVGQTLGGRYRLISLVGRGASGQVFVADDEVLRRRVAVKVLHRALADDDTFLRRFRAEAQAAAALNHPHVMAVHDWGQDDEPYLVTEYLAGGSLRAMLDGGRTLTLAQTVLVGLEAARGLEYAHRRGFIHRDIKPANLLFDDEARLRIADFGLARALAEAAWTEPTGAVLGTARYASPEQARGETLDGRSDVYSLALVMVETATGQVPFTADTALGTLMARVGKPLPVGDELGPLRPVLEAAGAPEPSDRPDAAALVAMLASVADELSRPEPLPLAGTGLDLDGPEGRGRETDPTTVAAGALAGAALLDDSADATPLAKPTRGDRRRARKAARSAAKAEARAERERARSAGDDERVVKRVTPASTSLEGATMVLHSADVGVLDDDARVGPVTLFDQDAVDGGDGGGPDRGRRRRHAGGPPRGSTRTRRWSWVLSIAALVVAIGAGALVWQARAETTLAEVGDYRGENIEAIAGELRQNGWTLVEVDEFAEDTLAGEILAQDPLPGTELGEGEVVTLTVSLGPPPVPVPDDLSGLTLEEATARLADAGFGIETAASAFDEVVPQGSVIGLGDGVPAELPKGDTVPVVVSEGPPPRTVPPLGGLTYDEADAELAGLGLVATRQDEYSESVDEGDVITSEPSEGETVPKGSEITVRVSLGPPLVIIPDVSGDTVSAAAAEIEASGLCVSGTQGSPTRAVTGTVPSRGTAVERGTCITITTN